MIRSARRLSHAIRSPSAPQEESGAGGDADAGLEAYRPGVDGPWTRDEASHLARRMVFGAPSDLVARILSQTPSEAAAEILAEKPENEDIRFTSDISRQVAGLDGAQASWIYRMLRGSNPAREKLALFWHGHFATSERKVDNVRLMLRQVDLFRTKGAGAFEDLLAAVARDPAMLIWLDGNSNRKGNPNENFARELFELFALGIGHYTEVDIKEAARAFTGWHVKADEFWFNERAHDAEPKRVLGREGTLDGGDVIRICVEEPASAEFIASKLYEFYVHPAPTKALRTALGKAFSAASRRTGEFLVRLLSSRAFFSARSRRALVTTPADFAVGSLATLGARANAGAVARSMAAMGQELLAPPSVKGWEMGEAWLNSTTLLARYRFAVSAAGVEGDKAEKDLGARWDGGSQLTDPVAEILARFFPERLSPDVEKALRSSASGDARLLAAGCLQLPEHQFF